MNKYCKGKRTIYATERAFEVIYKDQGFRLVKEKSKDDESAKENESTDDKEQENDEK
ncbi:hypothetical protein L1S24_07760 [Clostridium sporogenes]|uniref:hypothetical protein n=1 Tax=Clostridium sporogenes TaxID=1509 RepID=UPI001F294920|nr:hypothetical protein [Clostridium sporogenes]MCF4017047.1 hypothetical protein [Clostridium sporogenes]